MAICQIERNDQLFKVLEDRCLQDRFSDSMQTSAVGTCTIGHREDGARHLRIDSYSDSLGTISIEAESPSDPANEYIPRAARFRLLLSGMCGKDGENRIDLRELRVCEETPPSANTCVDDFSDPYLSSFQRSLETYMGAKLPLAELDDAYLRAEAAMFSSFAELDGQPPGVQQNYPTSVIRDFFAGIGSEESLEGIMLEFRKRMSSLGEYENTPFAARKGSPSSLFVCRRSAHEVIGSRFVFACGDYAETFLSLLKNTGMEARLLKVVGAEFIYGDGDMDVGHDLVEVFDRRTGRWVLTDPTAGKVYRKYNGEQQFTTSGVNWIVMGRWKSSWDAGCHSKYDLSELRAVGKQYNLSPQIPFVDVTDKQSQSR
ncbi:MAG: hypothetical protein V2A66_09460 [Pseudomonadota bacterium]